MKCMTQSHRELVFLQLFCPSPVPLVQDSRGPCKHEAPCVAPVPAALHPCLQTSQVTEPALLHLLQAVFGYLVPHQMYRDSSWLLM